MKLLLKMLLTSGAIACLTACGSSDGPVPVGSASSKALMGGGSSFVYPVMNRWASDYNKETGVQVNYQSLGSSGGIKQFSVKTLLFGATDAPMNAEQMAEVDGNVHHIPVVMGAVAMAYNLPGVEEQLTLSGEVLAEIYMGNIKKWNDPAITGLNPNVDLPDANIVAVRRADGSGTTFIFADFLGKRSPSWLENMGVGSSLSWPAGSIGGKGNEGVAGLLNMTENSIGYVELVYALQSGLPTAAIVNQAGNAVVPTVESVTAAAADLTEIPEDLRMSITDAPGEQSYPISGLTWVVARKEMDHANQAEALKKFFNFILSDEQQDVVAEMHYSKLPEKLLEPARAKVEQINGLN